MVLAYLLASLVSLQLHHGVEYSTPTLLLVLPNELRHHNKTIEEGWVYFAGDEHISIEVGVKDKPICDLTSHHKHRKNHILLVCSNFQWNELEYVKNRRENNVDEYKSQQYRHKDP